MAGEIQVNSVTALTESGSNIVLNNVDTATNRTNLGLGSMATQNANAVALTGGSITDTEIDLKSTGTSVYKSDGSTAVISESSGTVTVNNATLGSSVVFPVGHVIQTITDTHEPSSGTTITNNVSNDYLGSDLQCTITPKATGNTLIITAFIPDIFNNTSAGRSLMAGFAFDANFSSGNGTTIGSKTFVASFHGYDYQNISVITNLQYTTKVVVGTNAPSAGSASIIRPIFSGNGGDVQINTNADSSKNVCFLMVQEIQQ